jgi:hypothetical protein
VSDQSAVEIWFPVTADKDGYPSSQPWEQLHGWPTDDGYIIDNVPFFAKDVAVGDTVSARLTANGSYQFDAVLSRSGRSVFRIWLSEEAAVRLPKITAEIEGLGCRSEITLGRLIAIDVPAEAEQSAWDFVQRGSACGDWDVQVGYSPE